MTFLRFLGAGLLTLCGYWAGDQIRRRTHWHLNTLRQYRTLLDFWEQLILLKGLPCGQLLCEAQNNAEAFAQLGLSQCTELRGYRLPAQLPKQEVQILNEIFAVIGTRSAAELQPFLDYSRRQCLYFEEQAAQKCTQADCLYRKIGLLCGGISAVILL